MTAKLLPRTLTSYDLLKTLAIVLMVADHVGAFFFPDQLWLRVLGRLCVPMWFFLIGYAQSRTVDFVLLSGALAVLAGSMISGQTILPLNILFTIIAVRLVLGPVTRLAMMNVLTFWAVALVCVLLLPLSRVAFDYGTMGLLFALYGYLVRHVPARTIQIYGFALFCSALFVFTQGLIFLFDDLQFAALVAGTLAVMAGLSHFRPALLPHLGDTGLAATLLRLCGRHSLALYVGHVLVIEALALWLYPEKFVFLGWGWSFYAPAAAFP